MAAPTSVTPQSCWSRSSATACHAGAARAGMYTMGALLRHGSDEQKQRFLPEDRLGRAAPAVLRRHRARRRLRHDAHPHLRAARGRRVRRQRRQDLHLPGPALRPAAPAHAHEEARGLPPSRPTASPCCSSTCARPSRTARSSPRRSAPWSTTRRTSSRSRNLRVPVANRIGDEGKGFKVILSGMNSERVIVTSRVHRRRLLPARPRRPVRQRARGLRPSDRAEPGRPVPDRAGVRRAAGRVADALARSRDVRRGREPPLRGERARSCSPRRRCGARRRRPSTPSVATPPPRSTASSGSGARRGCPRPRRSPTTSSSPASPTARSACRSPSEQSRSTSHERIGADFSGAAGRSDPGPRPFAAGGPAAISDHADAVTRALVDTVGVAIASTGERAEQVLQAWAEREGSAGRATVWTTGGTAARPTQPCSTGPPPTSSTTTTSRRTHRCTPVPCSCRRS